MFLSGLDNIDFRGVAGLNGDIDGAAAANIVWDNMPWTVNAATLYTIANMTVDQFKASVASALSSNYKMVQSSSAPADAVDASVISKNYPKAASYISTAFDNMQGNGYYIVPVRQTQVAPSAAPTYTQPASSGGSSDSIAYRGAVASQQAGRTAQASPDILTQAAQGVQSFLAPITGRQQLPTIYKKVPYRQTPADRTRLLWIIGGFGVLFAITIGVIAGRN